MEITTTTPAMSISEKLCIKAWFWRKEMSVMNLNLARKVEIVRETAKAYLVQWSDFAGGLPNAKAEKWVPKSCTEPATQTKQAPVSAQSKTSHATCTAEKFAQYRCMSCGHTFKGLYPKSRAWCPVCGDVDTQTPLKVLEVL